MQTYQGWWSLLGCSCTTILSYWPGMMGLGSVSYRNRFGVITTRPPPVRGYIYSVGWPLPRYLVWSSGGFGFLFLFSCSRLTG
jgi:hypothetical protein